MDVKAVRGLGMGISDHYVVLCKIRLVGAWMEKIEVRKEVGRIKSEKLNEQGYKETYVRTLLNKSVECEQDGTEQIWEQMKYTLVSSAEKFVDALK